MFLNSNSMLIFFKAVSNISDLKHNFRTLWGTRMDKKHPFIIHKKIAVIINMWGNGFDN